MIHEGPGNVIDFKEMKKQLKNRPPKANTPDDQINFDSLQQCLDEILTVLNKHECEMVTVPKMEVIAPGVFRLLGDWVLRKKPT